MQHISSSFNRFYHSRILRDMFDHSHKIVFNEFKDTRTGGAFTIYKWEDYSDLDELKQLLKLLNINYAVAEDGEGKISTSDINSKALSQHIEFCLRLCAFNGIELPMVTEEFERLKDMARC